MSRLGGSLWWRGSLQVELRGQRLAAGIDRLVQSGVVLQDVRVRAGSCTLWFALSDFPTVYRVCRQERLKLRFLERFGLPFVARRLLRRQTLWLGAGVFIVLLYMATSMVWQVTVTGVGPEQAQAVLAAARQSGLYVGAMRTGLGQPEEVEQQILDHTSDAAWIGLTLSGSRATIQVVPKIPSVIADLDQPHNVIIAKPAVIRKVIATRGVVLVKPGQVVHPGEVAISGLLGDGETRVAASGEVWAEVWYRSRVELTLTASTASFSGASVDRDYLQLGPLSLRLWGWSEPQYAREVRRVRVTDWRIGHWVLPVQWRTVQLWEVRQSVFQRSVLDATREALQLTAADVKRQMGAGGRLLGQTTLQPLVSRGKLYETVLSRTQENIGAPAAIAPPLSDGVQSLAPRG